MTGQKYFLLLFALFFIRCKGDFEVEYSIENTSRQTIEIEFRKTEGTTLQFNSIHSGQTLYLHSEIVNAKSLEKYFEENTSLPFSFIEVKSIDGKELRCKAENDDCWSHYIRGKQDDFASVILSLQEDDFEQ